MSSPRHPAVAAALDVAVLLVFAAVGRRSHTESGHLLGVLGTAWPFLVGAALGWVVVLTRWHRAPWTLTDGVIVWLSTIVVGMLVRALAGGGTATSFIVVATLVTAALLLGWRLVASFADRRRNARQA